MGESVSEGRRHLLSKVPDVTIGFWIIKILATTVGETGGDALSMSANLGYAESTLVFLVFFAVAVAVQVSFRRYHPFVYWAVVVGTTTVGTTTSDYLDRTLELGYVKSSIVLFCGVLLILGVWHFVTGKIEFEDITRRDNEIFYWITILVSNTLGTALGDFTADTAGLGFERGALVFAALLAIVAAAHYFTTIPNSVLFWSAYVLTRPLGATLGDTLTKPRSHGGFDLSRITSSAVLAAFMIVGIVITMRRDARRKLIAEPQTASTADDDVRST